jgi:hypothetical protein
LLGALARLGLFAFTSAMRGVDEAFATVIDCLLPPRGPLWDYRAGCIE